MTPLVGAVVPALGTLRAQGAAHGVHVFPAPTQLDVPLHSRHATPGSVQRTTAPTHACVAEHSTSQTPRAQLIPALWQVCVEEHSTSQPTTSSQSTPRHDWSPVQRTSQPSTPAQSTVDWHEVVPLHVTLQLVAPSQVTPY